MRALAIAATGMSAQQTNVEVIANNIANINTTGFKRGKAEFTDLLYENERLQGVSNRGNGNLIPEGAQLGLGVRTAAIRNLQTQGTLTNTGNTFDLALSGRGWFQVTGPNGDTVYTRDGAFNTNATGQLVTLDGYTVNPSIVVPSNTTAVTVSQSGIVSATVAGNTAPVSLGQLTLANFANETGLEHLGDNLFRETAASGNAVTGVPGRPRLRDAQPGVSRGLERRPGQGDLRPHLGAARLRDELQGDPGRRPDGPDAVHGDPVMRRAGTRSPARVRLAVAVAVMESMFAGGVAEAAQTIPVPTVTIYPGDIIRDTMLTERDMPDDFAGRTMTVLDREALVGKTARRTLLPGLPIAVNGIGEPKIVTVGAMVKVVFNEGGLTISTYASALQAGAVGDVISVRNMESGLTVSGTVDRDGSVKVNNG